jgi:hypothetical protein
MTTPVKKVRPKEVAILHVCTQEKQISKMSLLLVGNGNPKDGYIYKVMEMSDEMKNMNEKLTGISGIVKELHEKSIGKNEIEKTDKENRAERRAVWQKWVMTISCVVGALALILTLYLSFRSNEKQNVIITKQDDLGVPFIRSSRTGEFIALPDSTRIVFFPNDSIVYTIIKR